MEAFKAITSVKPAPSTAETHAWTLSMEKSDNIAAATPMATPTARAAAPGLRTVRSSQ
jgi:hypothetical protein